MARALVLGARHLRSPPLPSCRPSIHQPINKERWQAQAWPLH